MPIKFEKVSFVQFASALQKNHGEMTVEEARSLYEGISLPKRATKKSAGYDFCLPLTITVNPHESVLIPTGIRVALEEDLVCLIMPRSSYGMKYGMSLNNTVGVIDADYYEADNEGHIMIKVTFDGIEEPLTLEAGQRFAQGIIMKYYVTDDDRTDEKRTGGMGSTDAQ